ncbi:hypothetical protein [Effusibacillus pohliae]|uniref:hypothetical protein n=1 Tax=Effusibacillus pohliae TaxID=232270 RepID=UPI0012EAE197|nr:hypothetical protein [Effusibacillus pohliae]
MLQDNPKSICGYFGETKTKSLARFKVVATSEKGAQQTVLSGDFLSGENWGVPASSPSLISLPTSGLWRFDVYIDDKLNGSIVVQVK